MMEGALMTEMTQLRYAEQSKKNDIKNVFGGIDYIGKEFNLNNPRFIRNLGDWRVNRKDIGSRRRSIEISKGKAKQHLKIYYEKESMTSFDFTLSDGKTIVSISAEGDYQYKIEKHDKKGELIEGPNELTDKEYRELSNYPLKMWIDRKVNSIVGVVDPTEVLRYGIPAILTVGIASHATFTGLQLNKDHIMPSITSIGRPVLKQTIGNLENSAKNSDKELVMLSEKSPLVNAIFYDKEAKKSHDVLESTKTNFVRPEDSKLQMNSLVLIENLRLVSRFFLNPELNNGRDFSVLMNKYLRHDQDGMGQYKWRKYDDKHRLTNELVSPLGELVTLMRTEKDPKSQESFYRALDYFLRFTNPNYSQISPEKVMSQMGSANNGNAGGSELWDSYWSTTPKKFNQGEIKGYSVFIDGTLPGDLLVTKDGTIQIVISVTIGENENLKVHTLQYLPGGKIIRRTFDYNNFPTGSVVAFRNEAK